MRIAFFLFILLPSLALSQEWKDKYDQFFSGYSQDLEASLKLGKDLLNEMPRDTNYADVCYYMAYGYFSLSDFTSAAHYAAEERKIRAEWQGEHHGSYLNATYYLSIYNAWIPDYDIAIPLMEEVVEKMSLTYAKTDLSLLTIKNQLAGFYAGAGANKKAEEIYETNYDIIRSSFSPVDSTYQQMTNVIASFYTQSGQYDKAIPFFLSACEQQKKNFGKKSNEYMASYNSLGELYIYAGMYNEAEKLYMEFVELSEEFYGKKSADYATALNNLAVAYEKQNRFEEAEKLYLKSLSIKAKVYTKESDYYALTLINLGVVYDYLGQFDKAEKVLDEAIGIYERHYEGDNANYATALNNIASIYTASGKYAKAIEVLNHSLEINKKKYGESSPGYLISLNSLGSVYQSMGEYDKALEIYNQAAPLYEKSLGKFHSDYGVVLFNIANIQVAKGNYSKALDLLDQDLSIQETAVGKIHIKYANALQTKASVLGLMGLMRKADELYLESGEVYTKLYGKMHPDYAVYLNNYGLFLFNKGDYYKAEEMLNDAWDIQANAFGENHPDNISLLCNLANIEVEKNKFKQAESHLMQAMQIAKDNFKPGQPDYSSTLNNVATLYYHLGNYDKAESYYKEALELRKNFYGEKHTEYAVSLNNMGSLYLARASSTDKNEVMMENTSKAISYFKHALAVDSIAIGYENPERASHLNNLAEAYRLRNEPVPAEKLFKQCIELEEKYYGKDNAHSAVTYHNLALVYEGLLEHEKAEENALKSLIIFEKNYGKNSTAASGVTASLAYIYESMGKNDTAKEYYLAALKSQRDLLEQNFSFLSESEKENYINSVSLYNDMFNTFASKTKKADPAVTGIVYDNEIYNKGLLFRSSTRVKDIILRSKNQDLINTYTNWMDIRQELSVLYSTPAEDRTQDIQNVEEKANELEKELIKKSEGVKIALNNSQGNWKDVQVKLKPGQAAIEFAHFMYNDAEKEDWYCALIITPTSSAPVMTELFTAKQLKELIGKNTTTTYESVSSLYGKQKTLNVNLFSLIWGPLEGSLSGITEIYYAPSGLLYKISMSALGDANGRYVSDKYILHEVNSTASLLNLSSEKLDPAKSTMALIGGVKYDSDKSTQHVWSYLPGTLSETEKINVSLTKSGMKTEMFTADLATEEIVKKMDGEASPSIFHVATHGFFFGDPQQQKEEIKKTVSAVKFRGESRGVKTLVENPNPLMRSGIVLAGANDIWTETRNEDSDDGILTAYEVSLMNLKNTKLVVLSACETGLGDIKGSEGVYGLQRAFRIAGADFLIMSLWQVPDKETEEFMTTFYAELIKTKEIRKSFVNTQKIMRAKYDPYFWAAFVLIE